jgi:hypothetical protein
MNPPPIPQSVPKPPRWWQVLITALLAAGALWVLWMQIYAVVPKTYKSVRDLNVVPVTAFKVLANSDFLYDWGVWIAGTFVAVASLAALTWLVPVRKRRVAFVLLKASTLILFCTDLTISSLSAIQEIFVSEAHWRKEKFFIEALDAFGLRQGAEQKFETFQKNEAWSRHVKPVELKEVSQLSFDERVRRVQNLVSYLSEPESPALRKQVLASLSEFEPSFAANMPKSMKKKDTPSAKQTLKTARELGVPEDATVGVEEFFAWLRPRLHSDGWEPLPIIVFRYEP